MGVENARIKNFHHDKLSVYGIGREFTKQEWQSIFRQLVATNLLKVDMVNHGSIKITEDGFKFLREKESIALRTHKHIKQSGRHKVIAVKTLVTLYTQKERDIFKLLKDKRFEIAKEQKVPPYVIFHDKTLVEMINANPQSLTDMSSVSGVGAAKIKRYGQLFLDIIRDEMGQKNV